MGPASTERDTLVDPIEALDDVEVDVSGLIVVPAPTTSSITLAPVAYGLADSEEVAVVASFRPRRLDPRIITGLFVGVAGTIVGVFVGLVVAASPGDVAPRRFAHQVSHPPRPLALLTPAHAPAKRTAQQERRAASLPAQVRVAPPPRAAAAPARTSTEAASDQQLLRAAMLERPL